MAIEVMDAVEGWDETCYFAGAILGFCLILFLISRVNLLTCRYIKKRMSIKVLGTEDKTSGRLYNVEANDLKLKLLFTWHSLGRIAVWGLRVEQVLDALLFPEEVVTGHFNRFIAHKRHNEHIVRAVYEYNMSMPVIVTVYYPSAERYFEGGGKFADKILP